MIASVRSPRRAGDQDRLAEHPHLDKGTARLGGSEHGHDPQVFLPYAIMKDGQTLSEHVAANPEFLLGDG